MSPARQGTVSKPQRQVLGYNPTAVSLVDKILDLSPRALWRFAGRSGAAVRRALGRSPSIPRISPDFLRRQDAKAEALLHRITAGEPLDDVLQGFDAKSLGERIAEYPICLDWLQQHESVDDLLDVGCVLNKGFLGPFLRRHCRSLWLCNPALEPLAIEDLPVFYHPAPLAEAFADGRTFQRLTCLSTLEHIGYDNSHYGVAVAPRFDTPDETPFLESLPQLVRLLAVGGRMLISFPYGRREVLIHPQSGRAASQVLDHAAVQRCLGAFEGTGVEVDFEVYAATAEGWLPQDSSNDGFRYANGCPGAEAVAILKGFKRPS